MLNQFVVPDQLKYVKSIMPVIRQNEFMKQCVFMDDQ